MEQELVEGVVGDTQATIGERAREMTDNAAALQAK